MHCARTPPPAPAYTQVAAERDARRAVAAEVQQLKAQAAADAEQLDR
jgi:hypothetical protein